MKDKKAEQNWWSALSGWLVRHQGRADYLFIYDGKRGRLDRCFDRNVSMSKVDEATVSKLYQAAAEGRLGLLRPKDLKPQLLTTDPVKMFSSGKEVPLAQDGKQQKPAEEKTVEAAELKLDDRNLERTAADPAMADRLHKAEAAYRQVVYEVPGTTPPGPTEPSVGGKEPEPKTVEPKPVEQTAPVTVPLQPEEPFGGEQQIADLANMVLNMGKPEPKEVVERLERERKEREELIAAQNMFIWASASEKRDQEALEIRMDLLEEREEQWLAETEIFHRQWMEKMSDMSRELQKMDQLGASEKECHEKIRDYLDGKTPAEKPGQEATQEQLQQEVPEVSGTMWGNTLRHFSRFAASEVPLSIRHVQVARHCRRILQEAKEHGIGSDELGLNPQELEAVQGTMEMGALVERGLTAQAMLTSGRPLFGKQYRNCLRDYLAMKGIEEALVPHVQAHQAEINTGDGPVSALQILMAHKGFHANDLREKMGRTNALAQLGRMDPQQVARMIRQGGGELAALGQQAIVSCYQNNSAPQAEAQPKAPQKGGPQR